MKQLSNIQNFYFLGIGGIGMSALARYFHAGGYSVCGYDKTPSDLTKSLVEEGIAVDYEDDFTKVSDNFLDRDKTLVVYTPAIPKDNSILNAFKNQGFTLKRRAEVLGLVTKSTKCLAVAGTHGKTTTSAILGHLLASTQVPMTAFLGGVAENYNSNLILKGNDVTVVEADEFDRSFLQLHPFIAGITSMDADHLDIYQEANSLKDAFQSFANLVPAEGTLLHKKGLPLSGKTVAVDESADFYATNIRIENGTYIFDLKTPIELVKGFRFYLPGRHNLFNATLAMAMAICCGISAEKLKPALESFRGVKRRFSYKIRTENLVLIDDYAHHPAEIDAVFDALKELYPNRKNLVVFQPHLFSRTRDFGDAFAESLSRFDEVFLLDIYPARELPIPGVTSAWLLEKMTLQNKKQIEKNNIAEAVMASQAEIIVLLGAGNIGEEVE
ncbi:MAG TPA: UDP-N-acetylmuramate--L-alanine ligase, partial [Flavobacteriaceae bacterium]|nr:UDP-N-acetylmuramate--L-alanine ligase [Flavobacteriaceae bacterium]